MRNSQNKSNISILITGDFCPVNRIEDLCKKKDFTLIYNDLFPYLKSCDISITNLECPLVTNSTPIRKTGPNIGADAKTVQGIKAGGFDLVTLANNHIMDHGRQGLMSTLDRCKAEGIETVGAGMDKGEARKIKYINKDGRSIAIINACENEFSIATTQRAGANPLKDINVIQDIAEAKKTADLILVIVHTGTEGFHLPSPRMAMRLRAYADFGASAVIAHHSHIPTGYEVYKGVPILYGLGNFIFDKAGKTFHGWNQGMLCRLDFHISDFQKLELIPFTQNGDNPGAHLMDEANKYNFLKKLEKYSGIIKDEDALAIEWTKYSTKVSYRRFIPTLLNFNKIEKIIFKRNLMKSSLVKERQLMKLLDLFRCDAHRETIIELLEEELNIKGNS